MKRQIRTLEGLMQAVRHRKAVIVRPGNGNIRIPAAFVIGMPARVVYSYIRQGMYLYKKGKKS